MINFESNKPQSIKVDLNKNQTITLDLSKNTGKPLKKVRISLIWDPVYSGYPFDLDLSCCVVRNGKLRSEYDICFFNNLFLSFIEHSPDSTTGSDAQGDDEDEYILIDLEKAEPDVTAIPILVNVFDAEDRKQTFGTSRGKVIVRNDETGEIIVQLNLSDDFFADTAVDVAQLIKGPRGWTLKTIAKGSTGTLNNLIAPYC